MFRVVPDAPVRRSGPLALVFPATTVLDTFRVPAVVVVRAIPPPPVPPATLLAALLTRVELTTLTVVAPPVTAIPPPLPVAELMVNVLFWTSTAVAPLIAIPPPSVVAAFPLNVSPRASRVPVDRLIPPPEVADVLALK